MNAVRIARPEIRALEPYVTAKQEPGTLRLNANELPYGDDGLNRYPPIRPDTLRARLARRFGVDESSLLVTRGSSEAIDLLVRSFCQAYSDNIVITPPTFSMYTVYADMQAAGTNVAPLRADADFAFDTRVIQDACDDRSKLVFLCSPNNPTGNVIDAEDVAALASARRGRSLVVVDEAYMEFSGRPSLAALLSDHDNIVVLRTLSKAGGMAGARCGAAIARPEVIDLLSRMQPPYAFSSPTVAALLAHLDDDAGTQRAIAAVIEQRDALATQLAALPCVERCWPSASNFLLTRFTDLAAVADRLQAQGILIRLFDGYPQLERCARITVGSPDEIARLIAALADLPGDAP